MIDPVTIKTAIKKSLRSHGPALAAGASIIILFLVLGHIMGGPASPHGTPAQEAAFRRDCMALIPPESCSSPAAIEKTYRVRMGQMLDRDRGVMVMTARRIARGELVDEKSYRQCVKDGECAALPGIPPKDKAAQPAAERRLFWHLAEGSGSLTPAVCDVMDLCRALLKTGALRPADLATDED